MRGKSGGVRSRFGAETPPRLWKPVIGPALAAGVPFSLHPPRPTSAPVVAGAETAAALLLRPVLGCPAKRAEEDAGPRCSG